VLVNSLIFYHQEIANCQTHSVNSSADFNISAAVSTHNSRDAGYACRSDFSGENLYLHDQSWMHEPMKYQKKDQISEI